MVTRKITLVAKDKKKKKEVKPDFKSSLPKEKQVKVTGKKGVVYGRKKRTNAKKLMPYKKK